MSNRFFVTLLAVLAILFGVFFATKNKTTPNSPSSSSNNQTSNHVVGEGKSGVVLIEYGDFQCSGCYVHEPTMRQIREKYKEQIFFKFRNFPLSSLHKNALIAARAAEAASLQNKFWEMHDILYENQDPNGQSGWVKASDPTSFFKDFAGQIGLDVDKFLNDLKGSQTNDVVLADIKDGESFGFTSTPSFTLNGEKIDPDNSLEAFSKVIDEAIAQKTGSNNQPQ